MLLQANAFGANPILEPADITASPLISRAATLVGRMRFAPTSVQFKLTDNATATLRNGRETQFRLSARFSDGSFFTNHDDR
jgi:hypothetical protein